MRLQRILEEESGPAKYEMFTPYVLRSIVFSPRRLVFEKKVMPSRAARGFKS